MLIVDNASKSSKYTYSHGNQQGVDENQRSKATNSILISKQTKQNTQMKIKQKRHMIGKRDAPENDDQLLLKHH